MKVPDANDLAQAALLDSLDDAAWLVDARSLTLRCANAAAARWLGLPADALPGRAADSLLPSLEDAAFWDEVRQGLAGSLVSEAELPTADGSAAWVLRRIVPLPQADGQPPHSYLVTLRDQRRERQAERERETVVAELRATLESTADGILVTDLNGGIRAFNRRFAGLWSLPEMALTERDDQRVRDWMRLNVTQPLLYQQRLDEVQQHMLLSATDTLTLVDGTLLERHTQPQWSRGRPIGRVYSFRELNRRRPGAPRRALCDGVDDWTQLPHRGAFVSHLEAAVTRARHNGASLSVLCIEFDRDALFACHPGEGSHARTLAELAEGLRAGLRTPHALARLGGARFGVLLEHAGDAAAEGLARRLLAHHGSHTPGAVVTDGLGAVAGIASYPQAGLGADELLTHAERALAQARCAGAGSLRVHRFASNLDSGRQQRLERALRDGLAEPAFRLQYQPRIALHSGRVQAVEALVRWHDTGHGDLLPAQFLPLACKAGLAGALDDWVLEQAVQQAVAWRGQGLDLPLTVNMGAWQLTQPGCARRVEAVLAHAGWPAAHLEIDVTEAALQSDPEAAMLSVQALRRLGVKLVLDDFGAGETSLSLLRRFPFTAVKIDRSLLRGVPRQPADRALVAGLVGLARSLGLQVLAEGVETEAQRQFVADLGCQGWQGFLCAPALDPRRLLQCALDRAAEPAAHITTHTPARAAANA